jgi:hypothetical protein
VKEYRGSDQRLVGSGRVKTRFGIRDKKCAEAFLPS